MRKLIASAVVAASVLLLSGSGTAHAASAYAQGVWYTTTSPGGEIQCGTYFDEIGDAIAPGYIYVNVRTYRMKNLYCATTWPTTQGNQIVVDAKVWAYTDYLGIGWFVCYDPAAQSPSIGNYYVQTYVTFQSCGHLNYYVETRHQVQLWNGNLSTYINTPTPYPIVIG